MKTITTMKLIDYETIVKKMKEENSADLVDNDTVEHAKILVSELVNSSQKSIKLYTNSFCKEFYLSEKVFSVFKDASNRGIKLDVLAEKNLSDNEAIKEYKTLFGCKFFLKDSVAPLQMEIADNKHITLNNFMIIDEKGIRYEQENRANICNNIQDIKARGTFNRPKDIEPFIKVFNNELPR